MKIPPTRTHLQLACWINTDPKMSRLLRAETFSSWSNTDRKIPGTRLISKGRGRRGTLLRIYTVVGHNEVFCHDTSETYRRHEEARTWVENFLEGTKNRARSHRKAKRG